MERWAGLLGPAILLTALGLAPALGYATTHFVLALAAVTAFLWAAAAARGAPPSTSLRLVPLPRKRERISGAPPQDLSVGTPLPLAGEGDQRSWWRGERQTPAYLVALAFLLISASALITAKAPADLLPLAGLAALLFYAPLARVLGGADLTRWALIGTGVGLAAALFYRFGLGMPRAAEGFWLIDPYRLAVTTLLAAFLGLGALFGDAPGRRWLSLLGLVAALGVIVLTGSRTALLALPVLLLVTGLCLAKRPVTRVAIVGVVVALALAALFVELPGTARVRLWDVLQTIASGGQVADAAIDIRLGLHGAAAELFALSPIVGQGWSEAVMPLVLDRLRPDQLTWGRIAHLHNDMAQFAVSGGLLGLGAWLLMLAAPIAGWLRLPREARTPRRRHALLVLVIGAVVLGVPDTYLGAPMTLTVYVVLVAAVVGRAAPHPGPLPSGERGR
jgi:O-antigen ligase